LWWRLADPTTREPLQPSEEAKVAEASGLLGSSGVRVEEEDERRYNGERFDLNPLFYIYKTISNK